MLLNKLCYSVFGDEIDARSTKKRLKQAIVNSGLSHRTLESLTGISRTTIFRYANEQVDKIPF